ncbi:MAG: adenylate/guanylate cyclase domain-containing protein, partial [Actinomycetota bacterium]|nr:adenylate/guanylate cyclase domain-containing protein [Actinomycetota bacterium]
MTERSAQRLARFAGGLYLLLFITSLVFDLATKPTKGDPGLDIGEVLFTLSTAAFPIAAILILARQPRNRIGWILMAIGVAWVLEPYSYGAFALSRDLPGGQMAVALSAATWAPPIVLMGTVLLLRFPTGTLLSPRWRKVEWLALAALAATLLIVTFGPPRLGDSGFPHLANPLAIPALRPVFSGASPLLMLIPLSILLSAASLVVRFRRSRGVERLQLKWLAAAAATVAVMYLVAMVASIQHPWTGPETPTWVASLQVAALISFVLIPVSIGFAILKHRLYDIDLIINRAVVLGVIVAFITIVYVGAVAGIGAIVGSRQGSGIAPAIVATAIVGMAFQPLRLRARRFADRVVYGKHATPYEALAALAGPGSAAELSARVARLAVESTGARHAVVWLRAGRELRAAATWPDSGSSPSPVPVPTYGAPMLPEEQHVQPLMSNDDLLGAISVRGAPGEALPPSDQRLLADLAAHAAVALRHALDTIELPEGMVTFVMTDVEGSTALWEEEPSTMASALADHEAMIEEAVAANDGILLRERGEGDSTFSVFTDANAAVAAALAMQRALAAKRWPTPRPIRVRAAVHTGEVRARDRDYYGPVPNRCARLRAVAHGGQTILSRPARDAMQGSLPSGAGLLDLGAHRLKDLSSPEHIYQLCHPELPMDFPRLN